MDIKAKAHNKAFHLLIFLIIIYIRSACFVCHDFYSNFVSGQKGQLSQLYLFFNGWNEMHLYHLKKYLNIENTAVTHYILKKG